MKTTIKTLLLLMIATLGFFNLKIDKVTNLKASLSFVEHSASADSEEGGTKYFLKSTDVVNVNDTITKPGGSTCTSSYTRTTVSCIGEGNVPCTPSSTKTNERSDC